MSSRTPFARLVILLSGLALAGCEPPPPPGSDFVTPWEDVTGSLAATGPGDDWWRARVAAFASLAMFEGYASDRSTGLRSLAGQVNGMWSVPPAGQAARGAVDGAIVAAEAQRVVLDSLAAGSAPLRRAVDSLTRAQVAARRSAGVRAEVADRSLRHGAELARKILALSSAQTPRTFVLRHPDECAIASKGAAFTIAAQGGASAPAARPAASLARDRAESLVVESIERADALAAGRSRLRAPESPAECVGQRVRNRLRTRAAPARADG